MRAKVQSEQATSNCKGIRVRYDMPVSHACASLSEGGFTDVMKAISAPLGLARGVMSNPPQVGWRQPPDGHHLMNALDVWLNFDSTAGAAAMDYSTLNPSTHENRRKIGRV